MRAGSPSDPGGRVPIIRQRSLRRYGYAGVTISSSPGFVGWPPGMGRDEAAERARHRPLLPAGGRPRRASKGASVGTAPPPAGLLTGRGRSGAAGRPPELLPEAAADRGLELGTLPEEAQTLLGEAEQTPVQLPRHLPAGEAGEPFHLDRRGLHQQHPGELRPSLPGRSLEGTDLASQAATISPSRSRAA